MIYDVFIADGSVFEPDANFIKLSKLSKAELAAVQRIVTKQGGLDLVIRAEVLGDGR